MFGSFTKSTRASPACWFADVTRTTIYLWFGSLLMFGSFTKSTRRHGGSHRVMALEGALKTIINDFPHEHCSIAKNLLQRVAVYVLLSTSVENETEHYRLRQRKGGAKLLWLAGKWFVHAIVDSKRDTSDKHAKMAALLMVPFFLLSSAMVVSCVSLLWCKDAVMAGQQEQNGQGARHCSIVHLLLLYYSGHDGRIHQRKRRDFFALGAVAAFTSRQRKRHYRMADRQRSGRRGTRHLSNSVAFIGNEDSRTFEWGDRSGRRWRSPDPRRS